MLNSVASMGNYALKSDGNHNGLIPTAITVNMNPKHSSIWFQFTPQCVSLPCQNDWISNKRFICSKQIKISILNIYGK